MYQYFMGARSNISTKGATDPTVIEVTSDARDRIEKWLDKYVIDLDSLINTITSILNEKIEKIDVIDNKFMMMLLNGKIATMELLEESNPRCKLSYSNQEYTVVIGEQYIIESTFETINEIKVGVEVKDRTIRLGKEGVFIVLELDEYDESIYNAIKNNAKELKIWDNIASVMIWIKSLPIDVDSYDLSITLIDTEGYSITKASIIHHQIFKFIKSNTVGEYQVEYDGAWKAQHDIFEYQYNVYEKKCRIGVPHGVIIPMDYYISRWEYVKDYIKIMFDTLILINNTFGKTEK